jgi:hypothetical protein
MGHAADVMTPTAGLVLLNSAGKIEPDYQPPKESSPAPPKAPPPRFVVEVPSCNASPTLTPSPLSALIIRQGC